MVCVGGVVTGTDEMGLTGTDDGLLGTVVGVFPPDDGPVLPVTASPLFCCPIALAS